MEVRRYRPDDAAAAAALLTELGYPTEPAQVEARVGAAGDTAVFVAEDEGGVAGLAGMRVEWLLERDDPSCRLTALVVAERSRRLGVGSALVRAVERTAAEAGCATVVLTSGDRRADAHAFYRALGYDDTGRRFFKELTSGA